MDPTKAALCAYFLCVSRKPNGRKDLARTEALLREHAALRNVIRLRGPNPAPDDLEQIDTAADLLANVLNASRKS